MGKIIYALILSLLGLSSCTAPEDVSQKEKAVMPNRSHDERVEVRTVKVETAPFNYFVMTSGKIESERSEQIAAESTGYVSECAVRNNQMVAAGQHLADIDTRSLDLQMQKVKEAVFNNRLNYQSEVLSQESLLQGKRKGIIDTVYRKLKANSGLTSSEIELKMLQMEKSRSVIRAPFTGKTANLRFHKGSFVKAGEPIFLLYSPSMILNAKVLETDLELISIGQPAEIIPLAGRSKTKAIVVDINPVVDDSGLIEVKLKVVGKSFLLPGMNATATIHVPQRNGIALPKQAVLSKGGRHVVFTLKNGAANWNFVEVGKDNGREIEILSGLSVGEKVIISNNTQLGEGAPVREI
jgi:membrane fusion protein (multidrug efflux system)